MSDILFITIGSHGDVHPFIGLGRALALRGHRVRVATNAHFGALVERAGLGFVQLGDEALFNKWIDDPLVWHPHKGPGRVMAGVAETLDTVYDLAAQQSPETIVVGSSLAVGALCAAEKLGLRYATAHLAPITIRSYIALPTLPGGMNFTRMPAWFRRKFWEGGDRFVIDPKIVPALNTLRAKHGLPPVARILDGWWNAPLLTLGLWPDWFAPRAADAPKQLQLTGFPLYDESDHHEKLSPELEAWLAAGDAPIAFTPGSAMKHGRSFFASAAAACAKLGRRGLLLTRHADQIPTSLPEGVRHLTYAPFSELLPRCAAIVHHGGIGTTAQALRAGTPQLIMPMSHDQPDNAAHVKRLGCGDAISRRFFWSGRVAEKLKRLTTDPLVADACRHVRERFATDRSLERTVELIERL